MSEKDLQEKFGLFCEISGGKEGKLPFKGLKQWFKQAQMTVLTDDDLQSAYSTATQDKEGIQFSELMSLIGNISAAKQMDQKDINDRLCGATKPQQTISDDTAAKVYKDTV
ncbi:hypothetical protein CDAR_219771 [Caerostris darwini]|uniref:Uncharacterized protein n=1 Tax=Caerostris darwini TaxID=1538125 RepID=A0AAV4U083_9ARAC|nr:hypothetical protein CDAR_219771 [Caerostris darwini]